MRRVIVILLLAAIALSSACFADSAGEIRILGIPYIDENVPVSSSGYSALYMFGNGVISSQNLKHNPEMTFEDYIAEKYPTYTTFEVFKTVALEEMSVDCAKVDFTFGGDTFTILAAYTTDKAFDYLMLIDCAEEIRPELEASLDEIDLVLAPPAE
jgi:hypothetical protein